MTTALTFNDVTLSPVQHQGSLWIRATELARALGYSSEEMVSRVYRRNADEFTDDMTQLIEIAPEGQNGLPILKRGNPNPKTRIFSPRGCHMIAMLARTKVAKAFRRWVLDVLDKFAKAEHQPEALASDAPITPDQQCTLQAIVKARIEALPEAQRKGRGLYPQIWSRFNNHFRLARYCQLPQCRMSEAVAYLTQMDVTPAKNALPLSRPLPRPALPQDDGLPPEALDAMTDSRRAKRFRRLMEEVRGLAQKVGSTMDMVRLTTHPGARYVRIAPELDARYNALDQMHKIAVAGLYQAEHMLYCLYFLGEGVEFR